MIPLTSLANKGDGKAQFNLGAIYANGLGVTKDDVACLYVVDPGCSQGDEDASKLRGLIQEKMTPPRIAEAEKLALEWKSRQ